MASTVLIVDDEKNILLTLSHALQLAGYRTELAQTGQLALDVAAAKPVEAVLLERRGGWADASATVRELARDARDAG